MKKEIFYGLVIILYLLVPVSLLGIVGGALDQKYMIEPEYFSVSIDSTLTEIQKENKVKVIDREQKKVENRMNWFLIGGITAFCIATGLLIKRKAFIKQQQFI